MKHPHDMVMIVINMWTSRTKQGVFWRGCLRGKNLVDDRWWQLKLSNKPSSTKIMHWSRSCMPCMPIQTAAKRDLFIPHFPNRTITKRVGPMKHRRYYLMKSTISNGSNPHLRWFKSPFLVVQIPISGGSNPRFLVLQIPISGGSNTQKSSNLRVGPIQVYGLQIGPGSTCGHTIWVQPGRW